MPRVTKSLPLPVLYRWSHPFEIRYKGIRDQGLLESAVAMPQASFSGEYLHTDLFHMAAAYAFHLAENQPFLDGNKRTALMTALVFLDLNGYVVLDPAEHLYECHDCHRKQATRQRTIR